MKKSHNNGTVSSKLTFLSIETGRGPSIWDTYSHVKGNIENNDTGDIACDSYHNYMRDVELLKELGVKASFVFHCSIYLRKVLPGTTLQIYFNWVS